MRDDVAILCNHQKFCGEIYNEVGVSYNFYLSTKLFSHIDGKYTVYESFF